VSERHRDRGPDRDIVILLHGLARTHRIFWRMRPALRAAGFETIDYRYPSRSQSLDASVGGFARFLDRLQPGMSRVHCVGFSLGGLIARGALADPPPHLRVGRLVMIGSPNRGSAVLSVGPFARAARALVGPAIDDLKEGSGALARLGTPRVEIGVIAGTGRFFLLNPAAFVNLARGHVEPHDGTVEVRNTRFDGVSDFVAVPTNHTVMCHNPTVIAETIAFLKTGRFSHHQSQRPAAA
jgi:pimeloyl-ACP methyl ester carboxylesterase